MTFPLAYIRKDVSQKYTRNPPLFIGWRHPTLQVIHSFQPNRSRGYPSIIEVPADGGASAGHPGEHERGGRPARQRDAVPEPERILLCGELAVV